MSMTGAYVGVSDKQKEKEGGGAFLPLAPRRSAHGLLDKHLEKE
jgi:hypothetical protein